MVALKKKAVISADAAAWRRVEALVRQGKYATPSHLVREAVAEKLARLDDAALDVAVARYVEAGHASDDDALVSAQAFEEDNRSRPPAKTRRKSSKSSGSK